MTARQLVSMKSTSARSRITRLLARRASVRQSSNCPLVTTSRSPPIVTITLSPRRSVDSRSPSTLPPAGQAPRRGRQHKHIVCPHTGSAPASIRHAVAPAIPVRDPRVTFPLGAAPAAAVRSPAAARSPRPEGGRGLRGTMMPDATPADRGFHHLALLYRSSQEYLATLLSFARAGLALAEPVFIAVPAPAGDLLRERLAPACGRLVFADMATLGLNPARTIPAVSAFTDANPGQRVRYIGEPAWPTQIGRAS